MKDSDNVRVSAVLPGMVDRPTLGKTGDGTNPAEWLALALSGGGILLKPEHIAAVLEVVRDDTKAGENVNVPAPPGG